MLIIKKLQHFLVENNLIKTKKGKFKNNIEGTLKCIKLEYVLSWLLLIPVSWKIVYNKNK